MLLSQLSTSICVVWLGTAQIHHCPALGVTGPAAYHEAKLKMWAAPSSFLIQFP